MRDSLYSKIWPQDGLRSSNVWDDVLIMFDKKCGGRCKDGLGARNVMFDGSIEFYEHEDKRIVVKHHI